MRNEKSLKRITEADARTIKFSQIREFFREEGEKKITKWARQAVIGGQPRQKLSKRVHEYLRETLKVDDFIEIGGQPYRIRKFAEIVARTYLAEAQTEATLKLCQKYENDLVEVDQHSTDCDICKEFEGKIYSISGTHTRYPKLEKAPPFHPICRHSITPTSEEAIKVRDWRPFESKDDYIKRHKEDKSG